jgi:alcohol dehydrogenase YqhD (iron-dependent ADH family)
MKAFGFGVPATPGISFGNGVFARLQETAPTTGKSVVLLSARLTMRQAGIQDRAAELLEKSGVDGSSLPISWTPGATPLCGKSAI